ncbi:MAG TPA: choice-of-anchor D domain-containing protein, partial [Vicinamibacteria bacterium]|nr:choice-of-anchor D domain-containing protein [Vicinamibacteria bacterium]
TPAASGPRTGQLSIVDNDATSPQVVTLAGIGSALTLAPSYPGLDFGVQALGTTSTGQFATLTNTGTAAVTLLRILAVGDYTETHTCLGTLAGKASCAISVFFAPRASGLRYGNLIVTDSEPGSPHTVRLAGSGTSVSFTPASLQFAHQRIHTTSPPQTVSLTNTGTMPLSFASILASGDFAQTDTCGSVVGPRSTCTITVTFTPTARGGRTGDITISDSDGTSPQAIPLSGTGT